MRTDNLDPDTWPWTGRIPKRGIVDVPDDDSISEIVEHCLVGSSPERERRAWWHYTWATMDRLPAWDIPHWTQGDIDVHHWVTPDEFINWFAWNLITCYINVNRLTKGIRATENDIMSLLTSTDTGGFPHLLDPTDAHILRAKGKLETYAFQYLDGISAWREQPREPVDYPSTGLLSTLDLVRANFNDAHDYWLGRMQRRGDRSAVKRVEAIIWRIRRDGLYTSAQTLARMGI